MESMDLFDRTDRQSHTQHESCVCDGKQGVFLNNRHMSWALSIILLLNFFVFMTGYFLGKKQAVDQLNYKIDQESLTDHVYSSMYALYDTKAQPESSDTIEPEDEVAEADLAIEEPAVEQAVDITAQVQVSDEIPENTAEVTSIQNNGHEYYAQLVGFSSEKAAQQFVKKLAQRDITAHIKQRPSKTAKGRIVHWYQVITESFTKKEELLKLVENIKRRENLHDVRIITA
jgi:cell division septation protein DedD